MRQIGQLDNELDAYVFRDFLFNQGIACDVESGRDGLWLLWVHDEDRLAEVGRLFAEFKLNPGDKRFVSGAEGADKKRVAQEKEERKFARKQQRAMARGRLDGIISEPVTFALIVISVVVSLIIGFGQNQPVFRWLMISKFDYLPAMGVMLPEVRAGEVWRLITPVFMHLGIIHLLFNMMWLRDLGGMIERIQGRGYLVVFLVVTGIISNVAQYFASGPAFGGMSGVVYGLLGYVWLQSRLNPWSGYEMHSFTVNLMMIWLLLGVSGLIGNIANMTHVVGLVVGCAWGYFDGRRHQA